MLKISSNNCLQDFQTPEANSQFPLHAISHVKSLDDFEREISAAWHRAITSVIEVGKLCAEAAKTLSRPDLNALKFRLRMSDPTFSKLTRISEDPRMTDPKNHPHLPNSYGTLYELTNLNDREFDAAKSGGKISPTMQRKDAAALRSSNSKTQTSSKPKSIVLLNVIAIDDVSTEDFEKLQNVCSALAGCSTILVNKTFEFESIKSRVEATLPAAQQ